jgi:hypothetical protein
MNFSMNIEALGFQDYYERLGHLSVQQKPTDFCVAPINQISTIPTQSLIGTCLYRTAVV